MRVSNTIITKLICLDHSHCIFHGEILLFHPPIKIGSYVSNFCYFSTSDKVEAQFECLLNHKDEVPYNKNLEQFLGMKVKWKETDNVLQSLCHQEAFRLDMVDRYSLSDCNKSIYAIPLQWGLLILVTIAPSTLSETDQASSIKDINRWFVTLTGSQCFHILI